MPLFYCQIIEIMIKRTQMLYLKYFYIYSYLSKQKTKWLKSINHFLLKKVHLRNLYISVSHADYHLLLENWNKFIHYINVLVTNIY